MSDKWHTPAGSRQAWTVDILKQPHTLIAGQTGSGKSVIIAAIIHAAMMEPPDRRQLILVDPKRVELSRYRDAPHVLRYSSEPDDMPRALAYGMDIVESRFRAMQADGSRMYSGGDVYIIVDELADLMTTQRRKVEPILTRIGQIGRASKVHLVCATQHILSDVISSQIKVNMSAIIALHTRTRRDSYSLIQRPGCESLPRYGKAIYLTPEYDGVEIAIDRVPEDEEQRILRWWMEPSHSPQGQDKAAILRRIFGH